MVYISKINYEVFNGSSLILFAILPLKGLWARSADTNLTPA